MVGKLKLLFVLVFLFSFYSCQSFLQRNAANSDLGLQPLECLTSTKRPFLNELPDISFTEVNAFRLKNASVVWLNYDLLRDLRVDYPQDVDAIKDFKEELLDYFAYMIPSSKHHVGSDFVDLKQHFYVDRYGGYGIGCAYGSGRAGATGIMQIKGIGTTPLVGHDKDFSHSHGGESLEEALREAIWGEVLHHELPFGGNRVLAIIDTGTFTYWPDHGRERRAILIRENPLRPAHYLPNTSRISDEGEKNSVHHYFIDSEKQRMEQVVQYLRNILKKTGSNLQDASLPSHFKTEIDKGLAIIVIRWARQLASAFIKNIFHGAINTSNLEIFGKFLDYGTMTALPGYGRAYTLERDNATIFKQKNDFIFIIKSIVDTLKQYPDFNVKENVSRPKKFMNLFKNKLKYFEEKEFLTMAGFPVKLVEQGLRTDISKNLFKVFEDLIYYDKDEKRINVDKEMPKKLGRFDVSDILKILASSVTLKSMDLKNKLGSEIRNSSLRSSLVDLYKKYFLKLHSLAQIKGKISKENFQKVIIYNSIIRTKNYDELYRPILKNENIDLVNRYLQKSDSSALRKHIRDKIISSRRTYKNNSIFYSFLKENAHFETGTFVRMYYDGIKNQNLFRMRFLVYGNKISFFDRQIPIDIRQKKLMIKYSSGKSDISISIPVEVKINDYINFDVPLISDESILNIQVIVDKNNSLKFLLDKEMRPIFAKN